MASNNGLAVIVEDKREYDILSIFLHGPNYNIKWVTQMGEVETAIVIHSHKENTSMGDITSVKNLIKNNFRIIYFSDFFKK